MSQIRRVAIVGGNRIPFARSNGAYATASNQDMLTAALEGLIERFNLHGLRMGEVAAGAVLKHSRDFNLTRECVLGSRLSPQTPAYDIQQACGTGLEAALLVANKIALGQIECGIAGGVDTTSDAPIGVNEDLRQILLQINRAKSTGDKLKALTQLRPHNLKPELPRNGEPRTGLSMGQHCELMAQTWHIPRDEQDQLTLQSHQKMTAAYAEGWQDDLLTPFRGLTRDNNLRVDASLEKLDESLLEAAQDLGCPAWKAFWKITLPLSLPGIIAGCFLVFIPAVGEFVIPDLLGGSNTLMIGKTLWVEFFANRDWPVSSAVAVILLLILVIPIVLFQNQQQKMAEREG